MDPAPFIEMINDSDSEYLNTADRFGEGSQSNDYETSQVTEEKKKESALSVMTVAAAKVADQYKRLEEKWQELQAKRNARLEDVNSLHKKLLGSLAEKIKCQNEFSQQYIRVVESSQAYWLSERGSEKSRPSSHGLTYFPKDVPLKEKEANHKRKVEKLAKDLTESTEKRCKTLEEIVSLLTQDLEEAKNECHSLEKELDETAFSLQETLDIFNLLNSSEEAEEERSTATFVSCGVSVLSENAGQPPNTGSITSTEIRGFVLQKRSTTLLPSCVRDPVRENVQPGISSGNSSGIKRESNRTDDGRKMFSIENVSSCVNNYLAPISDKEIKRENVGLKNSVYYPSSHFLAKHHMGSKSGTDGTRMAPKKRGRPKKTDRAPTNPITNNIGIAVKRRPGRPRKYLKLDFNGAPSAI